MICDYYIHFGIFLRPSNVYKYEIDSCEMTLFCQVISMCACIFTSIVNVGYFYLSRLLVGLG